MQNKEYFYVSKDMSEEEMLEKALKLIQNTLDYKDRVIKEQKERIKFLESQLKLNENQMSEAMDLLKKKYYEISGEIASISSPEYRTLKRDLFKKFNVTNWSEISVCDYDRLLEYIKDLK